MVLTELDLPKVINAFAIAPEHTLRSPNKEISAVAQKSTLFTNPVEYASHRSILRKHRSSRRSSRSHSRNGGCEKCRGRDRFSHAMHQNKLLSYYSH